ncbi:ComEC/Rec2 family competence protein [Candidatus Bipolaricaulota bacterium]|nr:ComEC/Rec2 family competence protein [Candidatus Bipolaricaulota bacterium]
MGQALLPGLAVALGAGAALGVAMPAGLGSLAVALALLVGAAWRRSVPLLWGAALLAGTALTVQEPVPPHLQWQLPLLRAVTGRVVDIPEPHARTTSVTLQPADLPVRLLAYVPGEARIAPGDLVALTGRWGPPSSDGWGEYLARRGIHGLFWTNEVTMVEPGGPGLLRWAAHVRERLLERLYATVPADGGDLLAAVLLGARGRLPQEEEQAFRTAGVAHVLALSGLHVGVFAAGGWWLLGLLRVRPAWRYLILVPAVAFYAVLGGLRVSLLRAAIMFAVLGLFWVLWERGWVLKRWLDPLQGVAVAALVVLIIWPWSALDAGFQLSFAATGAIIVFLPAWLRSSLRGRMPRWLRRPADLAAVTVCAQIGSMPIVGTAFGYLAPYGLLANLLLVPWTAAILWGGLLILVLSPLSFAPAVGSAIHTVLIAPYLSAVRWLSFLPGAALPVGPGFALWCGFAALGVLLLRAVQEETFRGGVPLPRSGPVQ